jgi:hypothetical protein
MKNIKIFYLLLASFILMFSACEPIVDETNLVDSTTIEGVQLATQSTPGNKVTLGIAA